MPAIRSVVNPVLSFPRGHRWARIAALSLAWGLLGAASAPVHAAPTGQCSQDAICTGHFKQASQLYQEGQYARAVLEFQAAYDRRPEPRILVNIGRTLQKLGHAKEALDYYQRSQAAAPGDAAMQASVSKFIVEARAQLEAASRPRPDPSAEPSEEPKPNGEGAEQEPAPAGLDEPKEALPTLLQLPYGPPLVKYVVTSAPSRPVYKRWWFWTLIGAAAVGGAAAIAVGVTQRSDGSTTLPADVRAYYPAF